MKHYKILDKPIKLPAGEIKHYFRLHDKDLYISYVNVDKWPIDQYRYKIGRRMSYLDRFYISINHPIAYTLLEGDIIFCYVARRSFNSINEMVNYVGKIDITDLVDSYIEVNNHAIRCYIINDINKYLIYSISHIISEYLVHD